MLDPRILRDQFENVRQRLASRGPGFEEDLAVLAALDEVRRQQIPGLEGRRQERKQLGAQVVTAKQAGQETTALQHQSRVLGEQIKDLETELDATEAQRQPLLLKLPNVPHESVPQGASSADNKEIRRSGDVPTFDFDPKPHWVLGPALGILDFERAAKLSGARFSVLRGAGARLARALINFMLDLHTQKHGYLEVAPPVLVRAAMLEGTGNLPKFASDLFQVAGDFDLFLIPTAEVPLVNLHRDEILDGRTLPRKYVAYTPCFRSEAGSYGQDVRGLMRQHQFDKVELVKVTAPEDSYSALEQLTVDAEQVMKRLELPYRTLVLCTGDMGFAAAKTYDIEVWLPSQSTYREVSSCSNTEAFQARRANIKFRREGAGKAEHVHTLNGSGLAVGRTLIAILENYQRRDGSVVIPEALRSYMGGVDLIEPSREGVPE
jgi:seryl-tRNA synthetase